VGELAELVPFLRERVFDDTQSDQARGVARALLRSRRAGVDTGEAGQVLKRVAYDLWNRHPDYRREWAPAPAGAGGARPTVVPMRTVNPG
jgi:hypothetical protein